MKKIKNYIRTILQILLICILLPTNIQPSTAEITSSILITEVMISPAENENTNEWIELYNALSQPIDLAGWMIADEKETDTLQADSDHGNELTTVPPYGYAIITDKGTTVYETYTVDPNAVRLSVDDSTLCGYGLNNQKEKIILLDPSGTAIDSLEWGEDYDDIPGSPFTTIAAGNSLARYPDTDTDDSSLDFFECNAPTPGGENTQGRQNNQSNESESEDISCMSPSVLITELYYDTHPNLNAEYICLFNPTNTSVDLSGWYVTDEPWREPDDQPKILFPEDIQIPANASLYLTKNATAFFIETLRFPDYEYAVDSTLLVPQLQTVQTVTYSNTGGLVGLYTSSYVLIDLIIYGTPDQYISCWEGPSIPSSGKGIILKRNFVHGIPVDTNTAADWQHPRIYHIGQSDFLLQTIASVGEITTFVSPDNSYDALRDTLRNARSSIDLNMYEFTNPFLHKDLLDALQRNVRVRLFMEGSPIGGMDDREKCILSDLVAHGALIRFIVSDQENQVYARYQFNHAKYLIIDNETVIAESCNWAKTGVPTDPTFGNREWGIIIRDRTVAAQFSQVFEEDYDPQRRDSYPFDAMNISIPPSFSLDYKTPIGSYLPSFSSLTIRTPSMITPLFSPDTSEQAILDAIDHATTTIYIQQLYIYKDWEEVLNPFVEHLLNKSLHGVLVQVILDYNPEYEETTAKLNETKQLLEEYGIKVKFISSEWSPFATVHNKGMIVDNTTVLISSINWNEQSVRKNREAGILITNQEVASYYASVFLSDWSLHPLKTKTQDFSWADYKYLLLIAIVFSITIVLIVRDWRKRKWR